MKFILILLVVVIISYGQILGMHVWQDDNGLFFKLAHIGERAGYLSAGPFGSGPYKYIATPYIPIYNIFGHNTVPYFILTLIVYLLATLVVYKVYKAILGKKVGRIAGLLYAAGYIASDGFIRLFNSVVTSVSVMTISLLTFSYWSFFKKKGMKWYFLALLFYFLSVELARGRSHYLIAIVLIFELLFFTWKKPVARAFGMLFVRLLPFGFIFVRYFIENADQRSASVGKFVLGLLRGEYYQIYGFVSSVANVFIPDWLSSFFLKNVSHRWALVSVVMITLSGIFLTLRAKKKLLIFSSTIFLAWVFASREVFSVPEINPSGSQKILALLGGAILIILFCLFFAIKRKYKKVYILLALWLVINIAAYSAYNPLVVYESINRYLAHSFYAAVGLLAILFMGIKNGKMATLVKFWVAIWGLGNMVSSVVYQNKVLKSRSIPARKFYEQLKNFVSEVKKGDVFYFDVDDSASGYFNEAFSVASMPETTAIAWRYGVDRYDIKLFTNFEDLQKEVGGGNVDPDQLHSFWYENLNLTDTTEIIRDYFEGNVEGKVVDFTLNQNESQIALDFAKPLDSAHPIEISVSLSARPQKFSESDFPIQKAKESSPIAKDSRLKALAFDYQKVKESILETAGYQVSSHWRERTVDKLFDGDPTTYWQADRILFRNKNESLTIDLGGVESINRFVFINGFANNTPVDYSIEVSLDGAAWKEVKRVKEQTRLSPQDLQIVSFAEERARFVRMVIRETLNSDSPAISEAWPILLRFSELKVKDAENFLASPFSSLLNLEDYQRTLLLSGYRGQVQVYWLKDDRVWQTTPTSKIEIVYDGVVHGYKIKIPAGSLRLDSLKLSDFVVPGEIVVNSVQGR